MDTKIKLQNLIQFPNQNLPKGFNAAHKYFYVINIKRSDEAHVTTWPNLRNSPAFRSCESGAANY